VIESLKERREQIDGGNPRVEVLGEHEGRRAGATSDVGDLKTR